MKKPLVSILTPCYNEEGNIKKYIDKMLKQTYPNIELVIVNDGSTDKTEEIIMCQKRKIEKRKYKLTYVKKENCGVGSAINKALKVMNGEYFCWCDVDNYYADDYVEKCMLFFENNPEFNIVRCDGLLFYEDNLKEPYHYFSKGNNNILKKELFMNCLQEIDFHFGCAMIKTSAFDQVVPTRNIYESRVGQNWQILLPILYYFPSGYIDEQLFFYINRKNSITGTNANSLENMKSLYDEHEKILVNTILNMNIPYQNYYLGIIKEKYIIKKMNISRIYNSESDFQFFQKELKRIRSPLNKLKYFGLFPKYRKLRWNYEKM